MPVSVVLMESAGFVPPVALGAGSTAFQRSNSRACRTQNVVPPPAGREHRRVDVPDRPAAQDSRSPGTKQKLEPYV